MRSPPGRIMLTMSLRSRFISIPILSLIGIASAGCPGPEPSIGDDGTGGDAQSASSGQPGPTTGPGPGPQSGSSVSTGSGKGGEGPGQASVGSGGDATAGTGGAGDGGAGGNGQGGAGGDVGGGCPGGGVLGDVDNCGRCGRPCDADRVADDGMGELRLRCDNEMCTSKCEPGYGNFNFPGPDELDDGCETLVLRAFVTSFPEQFPFGSDGAEGAEGADEKCQEYAQESPGNLGNNWRAWVSDADSSPSTRFGYENLPGQTRWILLDEDQTPIALDLDQLLSGQLESPIGVNELGEPIDPVVVWTGTTPSGEERDGAHCDSWTAFTGEGVVAGVGNTQFSDDKWTAIPGTVACGTEEESHAHHLYCFELQ